jgi:hypothetical protein
MVKKPIIFKKRGSSTKIAARSMDYYFCRSQILHTFQYAIEFNHGRIQYFSRTNLSNKEITTEKRLMSMERNMMNNFTYVDDNLKYIHFEPIKWRIKIVPIVKYKRWKTNYLKDYYLNWTYYNKIWTINALYNIFYFEKHCQNDPALLEIMIMNIKNARFFPQVKTFLQEIYVDDIPIKPSPPVKFNKCLLKCKIPKVHEPDDLISGDDIKNYKRVIRPYKILINLHDCIYQMKCYNFMNERLHSPLTDKKKKTT